MVLLVGVGDAGFGMKAEYNAVVNAGASVHTGRAWVLGVGGPLEPSVAGKSTAPHATPGVAVDDLLRRGGRALPRGQTGRELFPKPNHAAQSYALIGRQAAGSAIKWWQTFARISVSTPRAANKRRMRAHIRSTHDLTDERDRTTLGTEAQLAVVPKRDLWLAPSACGHRRRQHGRPVRLT